MNTLQLRIAVYSKIHLSINKLQNTLQGRTSWVLLVMVVCCFPIAAFCKSGSQLSAVSCGGSSFSSPGTDSCSVYLTGPTSGKLLVSLSTDNGAVTVPSAVTVSARASATGFDAIVLGVTTPQVATITARAGSITKTFSIQLNSAATPTLSINATSVSFGGVVLNTPATQSVILTSSGTAAVTVNAASVTGTGFSVSGTTFPVTLSPGQAVTVSVQFDPIATGSATGLLTVNSNSSVNPTTAISLTARECLMKWISTGIHPVVSLTQSSATTSIARRVAALRIS